MTRDTFNIVFIVVMVVLIVFVFLPYERFRVSGTYIKIIRITIGVVAIGMTVANYLLNRL